MNNSELSSELKFENQNINTHNIRSIKINQHPEKVKDFCVEFDMSTGDKIHSMFPTVEEALNAIKDLKELLKEDQQICYI